MFIRNERRRERRSVGKCQKGWQVSRYPSCVCTLFPVLQNPFARSCIPLRKAWPTDIHAFPFIPTSAQLRGVYQESIWVVNDLLLSSKAFIPGHTFSLVCIFINLHSFSSLCFSLWLWTDMCVKAVTSGLFGATVWGDPTTLRCLMPQIANHLHETCKSEFLYIMSVC